VKLQLTEAVWLEETGALTLVELAQCSGMSASELRELVELGAIDPVDAAAPELNFAANCIVAARTASRLRNDLELDSHGVALVLSLLERVQELEHALARVNARLPMGGDHRSLS
jgi:chaperone modulatory protein CbpM